MEEDWLLNFARIFLVFSTICIYMIFVAGISLNKDKIKELEQKIEKLEEEK